MPEQDLRACGSRELEVRARGQVRVDDSVGRAPGRTGEPARGERRDLLRRRKIEDVDGNALTMLEVDGCELPVPRGVRDEEEVAVGPVADVDAVLLGEGAVRLDAAPGQLNVQRIGPLRPD